MWEAFHEEFGGILKIHSIFSGYTANDDLLSGHVTPLRW